MPRATPVYETQSVLVHYHLAWNPVTSEPRQQQPHVLSDIAGGLCSLVDERVSYFVFGRAQLQKIVFSLDIAFMFKTRPSRSVDVISHLSELHSRELRKLVNMLSSLK